MPNLRVSNPSIPNFANRARRRAGLGAILTTQPVVFPGADVFVSRGVGSFLTQANVALPGADMFTRRGLGSFPRRKRGVGAFLTSARVVLPGGNEFSKYANARNCATCAHPCGRRGMGQDGDVAPFGTSLESSVGTDIPSGILYDPTSDIGTTLTAPTIAPNIYTSATGGTTDFSLIGTQVPNAPSTNPNLDALNQALTNQAAGGTQLTSAQIASLAASAGVSAATVAKALASPTVQATTAGSLSSLGTSLSSWIAANPGALMLGGVGLFALVLISNGKKRR